MEKDEILENLINYCEKCNGSGKYFLPSLEWNIVQQEYVIMPEAHYCDECDIGKKMKKGAYSFNTEIK